MSQNQEISQTTTAKKKVVVAKKKPLIQPKITKSNPPEITNVTKVNENKENLNTSSNFLPTYPMLFSEELSGISSTQTVLQSAKSTTETQATETTEVIQKETEPVPVIPTDTDPMVPVKKKRGRKPKPKSPEDLIKIPKKRGRKPKVKIIDDSASSLGDSTQAVKKRGRKPKDKTTYSLIINQDSVSNINVFDNKTYIITLKITSDDLDEILGIQTTSEIEKQMEIPVGDPNPIHAKQINGNGSQANYSKENTETSQSKDNSLMGQKYTLTFQSTSIK